MFGISSEYIIKKYEGYEPKFGHDPEGAFLASYNQYEGPERKPEFDQEDAFTVSYNQTDPNIIRDGIDSVSVIAETSDTYLINYHGYVAGCLRVTRRGMIELGESLLGAQDGIPKWVIQGSVSDEELPWWVPDDYDVALTFECQECEKEVASENILTPGECEIESPEQFCEDCWEVIRTEWRTEHFR